MLSCNEGRRKNHGCRYNNDSPRYTRETVSLYFASVVKISYVFITKDEHTSFLCSGSLAAITNAKITLFFYPGKLF